MIAKSFIGLLTFLFFIGGGLCTTEIFPAGGGMTKGKNPYCFLLIMFTYMFNYCQIYIKL